MRDVLEQVASWLSQEQRAVDRLSGEARSLALQGKQTQEAVSELQERIETLDEAIGVLNSIGEQRALDLQAKIETLITHGLQTIFGDSLTFHILSSTRGKLQAMDFVIRSKQGDVEIETSIMDARGGGVAAVAGFLLRLIVLLLRPDVDPILFLDESFAQLSAEYEPRLAEFIKELTEKTPVQIILVTHSEAYSDVADNLYRFSLKEGVTQISSA